MERRIRNHIMTLLLVCSAITGVYGIAPCRLFPAAILSAQAAETDNNLEQVYINLPDVTAYYQAGEGREGPRAYLGGEELFLTENKAFSETGEPCSWYILLDISASIPRENRFPDIRNSLISFVNDLREQDEVILITFGDEIKTLLNGSESREKSTEIITGLENRDQNTKLFDALDTAAKQITSDADKEYKRRILTVISDGKDCADNTKTVEKITKDLTAKGIPVYTIAVENNEGDSEEQIQNYRSKFSTMASDTGGIPWTVDQGSSVLEGLERQRKLILESFRASFKKSDNIASRKTEDFLFYFPDGTSQSKSTLVTRSQPDLEAPSILDVVAVEKNEIIIKFSETVEQADQPGNYRVSKDGRTVGISQVIRSADADHTYSLLLSGNLENGTYDIQVNNIYDRSNEKNKLENPRQSISVAFQTESVSEDTEAPTKKVPVETADDSAEKPVETTVASAESSVNPVGTSVNNSTENVIEHKKNSEGSVVKPEEKRESIFELMKKKWPVVLGIIAAILALVIILILFVRKKRKPTVPDDNLKLTNEPGKKVHVGVDNAQRTRNIVLWIREGNGKESRKELLLRGSLLVGREKGKCEMYCDEPTLSGQHFILSAEEGNLICIENLSSTNGTLVNGNMITTKTTLHSGDVIQAGSLFFRIEFEG